MASLNKFTGIGNIGKIDTKFLSNGDSVTNFSIACNESYKDKNGEKVDKTEWISCVAYRKLSEIMDKYCSKGMQIYVEGKLETRKYTDKQGVEKYTTQIIVNEMKMLGSKQGGQDNDSESTKWQPQQTKTGSGFFDDLDSDIPF